MPCSVQRFHLIPFQVFIPRIGTSALEAPRCYHPVQFVVLECFNRLVWKLVLIYWDLYDCSFRFYRHVFIIFLLRFLNKSGQGRPGLSRGECHSGWPFCTRLGLATGLVGWLPSRLLWYPRRGSPAGLKGPNTYLSKFWFWWSPSVSQVRGRCWNSALNAEWLKGVFVTACRSCMSSSRLVWYKSSCNSSKRGN